MIGCSEIFKLINIILLSYLVLESFADSKQLLEVQKQSNLYIGFSVYSKTPLKRTVLGRPGLSRLILQKIYIRKIPDFCSVWRDFQYTEGPVERSFIVYFFILFILWVFYIVCSVFKHIKRFEKGNMPHRANRIYRPVHRTKEMYCCCMS